MHNNQFYKLHISQQEPTICIPLSRVPLAASGVHEWMAIKNANNLNAVREVAKERYRDEVKTSLQPPLQLLASITNRLELKKELFSVFDSADDDEIEAFWVVVHQTDDRITMSDTSKSTLQRKEKLQAFFDHCCQIRPYSLV